MCLWLVSPLVPSAVAAAPARQVTRLTVDEISRLIRESSEEGQIGPSSTEMMQKVLSLHQITVDRIMVPLKDVEVLDIKRLSDEKYELVDIINEIGHTRIPVVQGDKYRVIGYINVKDLLVSRGQENSVDVEKLIRQPLVFKKSATVAQALGELKKSGILIGLVKDEHARVCGIITLEDIIEEIVGEIVNGYDDSLQPNDPVKQQDRGLNP
jgi:CBS domain containing-hemolysin-like protein